MRDELLESVFSPQVGLVPWISEAIAPGLFACGCCQFSVQSGSLAELQPNLRLRLPFAQKSVIGAGCSDNPDHALRSSIFEMFERYCALVYDERDVIHAAATTLAAPSLDWRNLPALFIREHATSTWREQKLDATKPIRWITVYDLLQAREVSIPLIMAHTNLETIEGEQFWPQTTSGLAAHTSIEKALAAALYEAVERDAVESIWMTRSPLRSIDVDCVVSDELQAFLWEDQLECIDQQYYDATTDLGVPTVYAVRTLSPPIGYDVIVTCATHQDPEQALLKARREAEGQQIMRLYESGGALYTRYRSEEGCLSSDAQQERPDLSFLRSAAGPIALSHLKKTAASRTGLCSELGDLVAKIARTCGEIFVANLTTDPLRSLGIHVIKAVVPALMPLSPSQDEKFLHHPRLTRVAAHFGRSTRRPIELNLTAQPFC